MAYPLPTLEQIRDAILTDWRNSDSLVDVTVDSDNYIRASGIASAIVGLYQFQSWGINQFFPDTADVENLERFASVRGITRLPAVRATGTITFSGNVAANVPSGTVVQTEDGRQYSTTAVGVIGGGGTVTVAAQAMNAGAAGNLPDNTDASLQSAPAGILSAAVIATMGEGFDAETLASLLERVLDHLRHPPAGGHKYDYVKWAREVAGVTSAFAYPLRRGLGTTDVAILTNGAPSTDELRATVWAYIDARSPAGGEFLVLTPTLVTVNVTADVTLAAGAVLADVQASVESTLESYFSTLKPGDTVNRSRILASITDVPGVTDVNLTLPAASVPTLVDATHIQLAALGAVVIS
jgi:uncharacterized phage protein gp47/JayE